MLGGCAHNLYSALYLILDSSAMSLTWYAGFNAIQSRIEAHTPFEMFSNGGRGRASGETQRRSTWTDVP